MERELYRRLTNPDKKYLGKPFWSWNGDLEKDELLRQIEVMRTMRFGGFFMHSRTGLVTEYMGEKWFSLVRECAARGEKFDMEAWLYDEDRWPSGTCGGEVTKNQDYRLRFLSEYDNDEEALSQEYVVGIVCRYALLFENGKLKDAISVKGKCEVPSGYTYAVYAEELMANNDVYNGTAYLDTMNAEASQAFFESTLERYGKKCGDMFGKEILGIFTDEPHRGAIFTGFGITNKKRRIQRGCSLPIEKNTERNCAFRKSITLRFKVKIRRRHGMSIYWMICLRRILQRNIRSIAVNLV